jgi:putative hydrolase of HD superfamily
MILVAAIESQQLTERAMKAPEPADQRLSQQIAFLIEIDKLKQIYRRTYVTDGTRNENDAEHSWHLALMVFLLKEHARDRIDVAKVAYMVLIHDLVEIDAGDTFCYDSEGAKSKQAREEAAAERIFNLLPEDQAVQMRQIWDEFEARQSPEARYAAALDRLQPILLNYTTQGRSWREHGITADQVIAHNQHAEDGAPQLWAYVKRLLDDAVAKSYLPPGESEALE